MAQIIHKIECMISYLSGLSVYYRENTIQLSIMALNNLLNDLEKRQIIEIENEKTQYINYISNLLTNKGN